jgi:hypothetical protein
MDLLLPNIVGVEKSHSRPVFLAVASRTGEAATFRAVADRDSLLVSGLAGNLTSNLTPTG